MKTLISILSFFHANGFKGFLSIFIPAYFSQDCDLKNNGFDIISFKKPSGFYFRGRFFSKNRYN